MTNPNLFEPPTTDRLTQHLAAHPAQPGRPMQGWVFGAAMAGAILLSLLVAVLPAAGLLLIIVPVVVLTVLAAKAQRNKALHQQAVRAWELAMLREHREAMRRAWNLIPLLTSNPELSARCVTILAHTLDELACYEQAMAAMDFLLDRLPAEHPMALQLRVQRANAAFCSDHLADGDESLRKLRGTVEQMPPNPITAGYHLAKLVQDVRTGHFAEAVEHADDTARRLRPLGVHAGFGYGLLAYCHHRLADHADQPDDADSLRQRAARAWHRATLLIPPAALAHRYHELGTLCAAEPASATTPTTPPTDQPA